MEVASSSSYCFHSNVMGTNRLNVWNQLQSVGLSPDKPTELGPRCFKVECNAPGTFFSDEYKVFGGDSDIMMPRGVPHLSNYTTAYALDVNTNYHAVNVVTGGQIEMATCRYNYGTGET